MKNFHLLLAISLTAGTFLGSRYTVQNNFIIILISFIFALSIICTIFLKKSIAEDIYYDSNSNRRKNFRSSKIIQSHKGNSNIREIINLRSQPIPVVGVCILALIFLIVGYLNFCIYSIKEDKNIFYLISLDNNLSIEDITLEGRVSSYPKFKYGNLYFSLEAANVYVYDRNQGVMKNFRTGDVVDVRLRKNSLCSLKRDDFIRIIGSLEKRKSDNNIDINSYDFKNKDYSEIIYFLADEEVNKIVSCGFKYHIFSLRQKVVNCLENIYYRNLCYENACIAEAVILGNRNNVPGYLLDNFKKSGVFHVLAISGLHISIFMYFFVFLMKKINFSHVFIGFIILFLILYNLIVGQRASMLRATIMIVFVIFANELKREYSSQIILYNTYIIMMLFNPAFLIDIGFWLSFCSIAAIAFINPILLRFFKEIIPNFKWKSNYILRILMITFSINIAIFPMLAYFFGEVSQVSLFSNIVIIPVFYLALLILVMSSILGLIWPPIGGFFIKPSSIILSCILKMVEFFGKLSFSILRLEYFPLKYVLIYYLVLIIFLAVIVKYTDYRHNIK
ncbi:MAG: ComEC/Rec2 family competence protein [Actinobacteria bacterium]|nr:ComEC/Rec2 family competence protein [Actinomycetota bacterium]